MVTFLKIKMSFLQNLIRDVHLEKNILGFGAHSDNENAWSVLLANNIDLINTDKIEQCKNFIIKNNSKKGTILCRIEKFQRVPGNWINNKDIKSSTNNIEVVSPYYDKKIASIPDSTSKDLQNAVDSAEDSFPLWSKTNI